MVCCLNPYCDGNNGNPVNPDGAKHCQYCKEPLIPLLRRRFKVLRVLGQGGFGRTYLAEDHDRLKQLCVVKQLLPQGGSKAVELFQREAKQLQDLGKDNPQIPSLEAYFSENNALFLVQQFIEGETLAQELERRGQWTEQEVRKLLLDWLPLLAAVHAQGVVHRDLKPDNLMRRGDNGRVIMIDFGLSKEFKGSVVAMPGTTAGTYGYAPYEQMESGEAYPSSDLYSVGATCFHLLSGKHPGRLWLDNGYNWVQSWQSHVSQPLSPELTRVIDKCLRKDHTRRYQSAQEALQALTPATTKPSPPPPQPSPPPPQPAPKPKPPYTPTVRVPPANNQRKTKKKPIPWLHLCVYPGLYITMGFLLSWNVLLLALALALTLAVTLSWVLTVGWAMALSGAWARAGAVALSSALSGAGAFAWSMAWDWAWPGAEAEAWTAAGALSVFWAVILAVAGVRNKLLEYKYTYSQIFWILSLAASVGLAVGRVLYQIYPWYELWSLGD